MVWFHLDCPYPGAPMEAGALRGGHYRYMQELAQLEAHEPMEVPPEVLASMGPVRTPLCANKWEKALSGHPDRAFVAYLLRGMTRGFRIGFDCQAVSLESARKNMLSARQESAVVEAYLDKERAAGRVFGPLPRSCSQAVQVSRFGGIPKPHQPGKWRLIVDLSHPKGRSGVDKALCSISYASVDEASELVLRLGRYANLAKMDIANAYRIVPVHPADRPLLGMMWEGELLSMLPYPSGFDLHLRCLRQWLMPWSGS